MHQHGVRPIGRPNHHFQNGLQRRPDLKPDVGKLFVRHLSAQTNEDSLYRAFATNGLKVKKTKILVDEQTGQSKRCGFVTLYDRGQVTMAISKFNNAVVDGSAVIVVEAEPSKLQPKQSPHFNQNRTSSFPRPSFSVGSKSKSPFSSATHLQGSNASQRRAPVAAKKSVPLRSFKTADNTRDYYGPHESFSFRETSAYSPAQQQSAPLHSYASNRGYQEQRQQPGRDGGAAMPRLERRGRPYFFPSQDQPPRHQLPLNSVQLFASRAPLEHSSGTTDESSLSSLQEETNRSVDNRDGVVVSAYRASTTGMVNQYSTSEYREQYRSDRAAAAQLWDQQEDSHKRRRADGNWTSAGEYEPY